MRIARFRQLLEAKGPDLSRWPTPWADAARRLVATDATAARELDTAKRLEQLVIRHLTEQRTDAGSAEAVVRRLGTAALPPQRSHWFTAWLPLELLRFDFSPSWPRVAALAAVAGLGFVFGLTDLGLVGTRGTSVSMDTDLSMIVFEAEPLPGLRPL
jgi:hypothetical protein